MFLNNVCIVFVSVWFGVVVVKALDLRLEITDSQVQRQIARLIISRHAYATNSSD